MKAAAVLTFALALAVGCASAPPRLNETVVLRVGEPRQIGPDGFELTLRSVTDDSGCLSPTDCSTMLFNGTIVARMGDKSKLSKAQAIMKPGQALTLDLDGYRFQLTGIRRNSSNQFEATFVVLGPAGS